MPFQNPYNLNYYLLKKYPEIDLNILARKEMRYGNFLLTISIIGSSHLIEINEEFYEMLTCQQYTPGTNLIHGENVSKESFFVSESGSSFGYNFIAEAFTYDEEKFIEAEHSLFSGEHFLSYAFNKNSALTCIDVSGTSENHLLIHTWHTYPDYLTVVKTKTVLVWV